MTERAMEFLRRYEHALRNQAMGYGLSTQDCLLMKDEMLMHTDPELMDKWAEAEDTAINAAAKLRCKLYARKLGITGMTA